VAVDGTPTAGLQGLGALLRGKADQPVRLGLKRGRARHDTIVRPDSASAEADRRYDDWELTRRERVEQRGKGRIGYLHLRAMGTSNWTEFVRGFYPVFQREGLIIDVRHNRGGNIDSWILEKLMRKAWMYWQWREGAPAWNMQYAFRGKLAVLVDGHTASDGEAFAEGIKRLELGEVFGTRTWGGEIWLSFDTWLVDSGIATAAEYGVYGPEGTWLVEGHGVEPDHVVDNLPHATFLGSDAQLDAAVDWLLAEIQKDPMPVPPAPEFPDKSAPRR
jgi:tricorn protease